LISKMCRVFFFFFAPVDWFVIECRRYALFFHLIVMVRMWGIDVRYLWRVETLVMWYNKNVHCWRAATCANDFYHCRKLEVSVIWVCSRWTLKLNISIAPLCFRVPRSRYSGSSVYFFSRVFLFEVKP
jgi:hypothetical protein